MRLEDALAHEVIRRFANTGAGNESEAKFFRVKDSFGRLVTLKGIGLDTEPAVWNEGAIATRVSCFVM